MKNLLLAATAALLFVSLPVSAQTYKEQENVLRVMYPSVHSLEDVKTNDGINPIDRSAYDRALIHWVFEKCKNFSSNEVHFLTNGTRLVKVDSLMVPFKYLNGETGMISTGPALFIVACDKKSYIALILDQEKYLKHFTRQQDFATGQYQALVDLPILGAYPNMDQQSLADLLEQMLPHPEQQTVTK